VDVLIIGVWSGGDNRVADFFSGLNIFLGFEDLVRPAGSVDDRCELARFDWFFEVLSHLLVMVGCGKHGFFPGNSEATSAGIGFCVSGPRSEGKEAPRGFNARGSYYKEGAAETGRALAAMNTTRTGSALAFPSPP